MLIGLNIQMGVGDGVHHRLSSFIGESHHDGVCRLTREKFSRTKCLERKI